MHGIAACSLGKIASRDERTPEQLADSLLTILLDGIRRVD